MNTEASTRWIGNHRQPVDDNGAFIKERPEPRPVFYPSWLRKLQEAYQQAWELRYKTFDLSQLTADHIADPEADYLAARREVTTGLDRWDQMRRCSHRDWFEDHCQDCGMNLADWREMRGI